MEYRVLWLFYFSYIVRNICMRFLVSSSVIALSMFRMNFNTTKSFDYVNFIFVCLYRRDVRSSTLALTTFCTDVIPEN